MNPWAPVKVFILRKDQKAIYFRNCLQPKKASRAEQKKEKPRERGAYNKGKQ